MRLRATKLLSGTTLSTLLIVGACQSDSLQHPAPAVNPYPNQLVLYPDTLRVIVGTQLKVTALAMDNQHRVVQGGSYRFRSLSGSIFTVTLGGVITGVAEGRGILEVEGGAALESTEVQVVPPRPTVYLCATTSGWATATRRWRKHPRAMAWDTR